MSSSDLFGQLAESFSKDNSIIHPVEWAERRGMQLWSKQKEIAQSLIDNKKTAVRSGHATGKSFTAAMLAAWWIDSHPVDDVFVITTAPSSKQVHGILWEYIRKIHRNVGLDGKVQLSDNWLIGDRLVGFGRKPQDYDEYSFQGFHRKYVLVILDEAGGLNKWLWDAANLVTTSAFCRILAIGNPDDPSSQFAEVSREGSTWNKIKIPVHSSPNFTNESVGLEISENLVDEEWVESSRIDWGGEGHPFWTSKVLAEFPEVDQYAVIPLSWVRMANARWEQWFEHGDQPFGRRVFGVDVARMGADKTAIAHRQGNVIIDIQTMAKLDTESVADAVKLVTTRSDKIVVDVIGIGAGVYDKLKKQGYSVVGFNAGARTSEMDVSRKMGFVSLRSAGWWRLREALDPGRGSELCLPYDERLTADLITPRWWPQGGKYAVESKDDIRYRIKRSTDKADAVIMATWVSSGSIIPPDESSFKWADRDIEGTFGWDYDEEWMEMSRLD